MTRRNNSGTFTNAVVNGYQVTQVRRASENTVQETYGHDGGGRVTSVNRPGLNATLTYNSTEWDGFHCPVLSAPRLVEGRHYPDFIVGEHGPSLMSQGIAPEQSLLVGDVKLLGNSLYNQYVSPGDQKDQLNAILGYAKSRTTLRSAVFITFSTGERSKMAQLHLKVSKGAMKEGVLAFVVSFHKPNKHYNAE